MKQFFVVTVVLLALFATNSCERVSTRITDRAGREVAFSGTANRIISTAPSNTEIIVDLGMADRLVAVDINSADIEGIPEGLPRFDPFFPDAEFILALRPDLIIASGDKPAGSGDDPFRLLADAGISSVYIPMSYSINDIYLDIAFVADILRVQERGAELVEKMKTEIAEITAFVPRIENRRTVYYEISPPPEMMTMGEGSFIHDMISVIGAENVFGKDGWLVRPGAEALIERNPEVILTNVHFVDDPVGEIKNRLGFNHINAVINDRVYLIDKDSSARPSARITLALRQMAQAVYPELYAR
ncbi:MAG: ABC transporter substrate-binding protein [Treponema sp.]|nr:ABC transporter substrate-binding protein [Treponema sp.]